MRGPELQTVSVFIFLMYPTFLPNSHFSLSVLLLTVRPLRLRAEIRNIREPAKTTEQNPTLKATCFSAGQGFPLRYMELDGS